LNWYQLKNTDSIISPSLLVYPDRIRKNLELMITIAGDVKKLRPHIKTHKMVEIVSLQQAYGIEKFKCATIAEAELLGLCEAKDILLAMQPVKSQLERFFKLIKKYPKSKFSTIIDNPDTLSSINSKARDVDITISLWLDINNGMNRTGIISNQGAFDLFVKMTETSNVFAEGLHVYDGHIHNEDLLERTDVCNNDFEAVIQLKEKLQHVGVPVLNIVVGGSITFPIHAKRDGVDLSPGTTLLWDAGYTNHYKDLGFVPAAVLLTRVVSNPTSKSTCLDLGHKSVASEMPFPRVQFLGDKSIAQLSQHEEHLVIQSKGEYEIGKDFYTIPIHICPTVSKYAKVYVIENNELKTTWEVLARDHQLKI
jgi:D-serine deaminase-like pyridoxal phosphate-dependent protein